jgi:DNA-binding CsgD family transcriptional regulator
MESVRISSAPTAPSVRAEALALALDEVADGIATRDDEVSEESKREAQYWSCLLDILQRAKCGGAIRSSSGAILRINRMGLELLGEVDGEPDSRQRLRISQTLNALLKHSAARANGASPVTIRREAERALVIGTVPMNLPRARTLLVLVDPDICPRPNEQTLQRVWGLTPAEATLAAELAQGTAVPDLAKKLGVSRTTVRTHLAAIFAKTHTRRQAALVALLSRLAIIP